MNDDLTERLQKNLYSLHMRSIELSKAGDAADMAMILQTLALHSEALLAQAGKPAINSPGYDWNAAN